MAACPSPIRELRETFGFTQAMVSEESGVHQVALSLIEGGKRNYSDQMQERITSAILRMGEKRMVEIIRQLEKSHADSFRATMIKALSGADGMYVDQAKGGV